MAADPRFIAHVTDLLAGFGPVSVRRMFSGAGLFRDGLMFGLVIGDALYFKTGEAERAAYAATGSAPFTFRRAGGAMALTSYWSVPADLLEDADALCARARAAWAAARAKTADSRKVGGRKAPTRKAPPRRS